MVRYRQLIVSIAPIAITYYLVSFYLIIKIIDLGGNRNVVHRLNVGSVLSNGRALPLMPVDTLREFVANPQAILIDRTQR